MIKERDALNELVDKREKLLSATQAERDDLRAKLKIAEADRASAIRATADTLHVAVEDSVKLTSERDAALEKVAELEAFQVRIAPAAVVEGLIGERDAALARLREMADLAEEDGWDEAEKADLKYRRALTTARNLLENGPQDSGGCHGAGMSHELDRGLVCTCFGDYEGECQCPQHGCDAHAKYRAAATRAEKAEEAAELFRAERQDARGDESRAMYKVARLRVALRGLLEAIETWGRGRRPDAVEAAITAARVGMEETKA
jgi:hypothetical protein